MYDLNSIVLDSELKTYFVDEGCGVLQAFDAATDECRGTILLQGGVIQADPEDLLIQYKLWLTRPERAVGKSVAIDNVSSTDLIDTYEELIVGCAILLAKQKSKSVTVLSLLPNLKSTLNWLRSTDFYTAPASTIYHESFPSGLLVHSLKVYNQAMELRKVASFSDVNVEDAAIAALVHDWCKIGLYQSYNKNVKNEVTGEWEKVIAYKRDPKGLMLGHGATSMYLACRCFPISFEVAAAIRWHMSSYSVSEKEEFELFESTDRYPLVLLIQFADQLAVTNFAK